MSASGAWFVPSLEAVREVHEIEHNELAMPDFSGLADIAIGHNVGAAPGSQHITDERLRAAYFDALLELHRLVEEYRFHVALAHLLALDIAPKVDAGLAATREPVSDESDVALILFDEARALLLPYFARMPSAIDTFRDPHQLITSNRRFSGWIAGQMIDSAFVRGVAALDRIATMAWARAGRQLPKGRTGEEFLPEFSTRRLSQISDAFVDRDGWAELIELGDHVIFNAVRRFRDGFTHARRMASELHGEKTFGSYLGPTLTGTDAGTHLALGLAFYDLVLVPAIASARRLFAITETEAPSPE